MAGRNVPWSLLLVTLVPADDDAVTVLGPFSAVSCLAETLLGEPYPHGRGRPDVALARYDGSAWRAADGRALFGWTVRSLDAARAAGGVERARADYVCREFPPEDGAGG